MKRTKISLIFILVALVWLVLGLGLVYFTAQKEDKEYRETQLNAAIHMEEAEAYLKEIVVSKGLEFDEEDLNMTGLIGPLVSELTSTPGDEKAKRSSLNPEFAAAMVRYYHDAGVKEGDKIAIGTSGSFPGFVVANVIAATEMGLDCKIIASLGASMHGATRPEFNVFDFLWYLREGGFADFDLLAVSCGASNDHGGGIFEDWFYEHTELVSIALCEEAAERFGCEFIFMDDLDDSINRRHELFGDDIKLFVNVGGASTNSGASSYTLDFPQGLVLDAPKIPEDTPYKGLNFIYGGMGIPVLNLLNVKLLCQENGIPFDPIPLSKAGETNVYSTISYSRPMILLTLVGFFIILTSGVAVTIFKRRKDY